MPSNVLFIVEGAVREENYLRECFEKLGLSGTFDIFSYGCNLYNFFDCLHKAQQDNDFSDIDVLSALRENARELPCKKDIELLSRQYTDIFLIFDLDNHDADHKPKDRYKILQTMAKFFANSTDIGQLIIDSPMVEAYCDVTVDDVTDKVTLNKDISILESVDYKQLVDNRGLLKDNVSNYGRDTFLILARLHYKKLRALTSERGGLSLYPNYDLTRFVDAVLERIKDTQIIPVVAFITLLPMFLSSAIEKEILSMPLDRGMHFQRRKNGR